MNQKQKLKVQEPKSCTSLKQERNMICSEGEISGLIELTEELETDLYSGCYSNTCTTHPYSPAPLPSSSYGPSSPFPSKKEQTKSNSSPLPKKQKNTSTLPTTKPMKPLTNKQMNNTQQTKQILYEKAYAVTKEMIKRLKEDTQSFKGTFDAANNLEFQISHIKDHELNQPLTPINK